MKSGLVLTVLLISLPASAKWGDEAICEGSVANLAAEARSKAITYSELSQAVVRFPKLVDKVRAVHAVLPFVSDKNNIDGAIQILNHLRQTQSMYQAEEAEIVYDVTRTLSGITSADLARLIDSIRYFKNKMSAFKMTNNVLIGRKVLDLDADGAAMILTALTRKQSDFRDQEIEAAWQLQSQLQTLTVAQLVNLVETARYTDTKVKLYNGLINKVSNKNDFDSILRLFKSIATDSQTEVDMFWKLRQLEPRIDAERLLALSRVARTSRAQAKVFEYFEPLTKQILKD